MKTTILTVLIAIVALGFTGIDAPSASAEPAADAPVRIHQPSAIERGIGAAPVPFGTAPFAGVPAGAC